MKRAPVNKIIPFSNVDGPGNRTSVFFQGCPFNCLYCHNPETIRLCSHCGACVPRCPVQALRVDEAGNVQWDSGKCVSCDTCIRLCPHDASPRVKWMTVEEVLREIGRSAPYIDGITTSGGECTQYMDFLVDLFARVQKMGKTCLIDSNGSYDFQGNPEVLDCCDGVMLDVKAVDREWSGRLISHPPEIVLKNLEYLLQNGKLQEVRTVILPGRDRENEETVRTVAERIGNACLYKIIRYRPFGVREKYQKILGEFQAEEEYAERFAALAREYGAGKAAVI